MLRDLTVSKVESFMVDIYRSLVRWDFWTPLSVPSVCLSVWPLGPLHALEVAQPGEQEATSDSGTE